MAVIYTVDHLFGVAVPDCSPQIIFQPTFSLLDFCTCKTALDTQIESIHGLCYSLFKK